MSIEDHAAELAALWPVLPKALARDTTGNDTPARMWPGACTLVNTDVQAALLTLSHDVPAVTRAACQALAEPWQHRTVLACLRQLPRLAARMRDLGMADGENQLTGRVWEWLCLAKRALGLRRPDIPVGYPCPWADSRPESHVPGRELLCAGDEGFLRPGPDGMRVEWVVSGQIYCPDKPCGASWSQGQWRLLGRMLGTAVAV